jgi:uncharacterized protein YdeI (BOF family)
MTLKTLLLACTSSALLVAPAAAQSPYSSQEGGFLSLSGTVNSVDDDSFTLDYGQDTVEVEFEDAGWDFDAGEMLYAGDEVMVYGTADDDFFEGRVIEANTVFIRDQSMVYSSETDLPTAYLIDMGPSGDMTGTTVSLEGMVTDVSDREFTLDVDGTEISVDTMSMSYNPLDREGRQQIQEDDRVTVVGQIDDALFDETELSATAIFSNEMSSNSNRNRSSMMSNRSNRGDERSRDRDDREDRSNRYSNRDDDNERSSRRNDRENNRDMDRRRSNRGNASEEMFNESEFAMLDANNNGVVTQREYVRRTADLENITRSEARELFAAISGDDDELTRREFLDPDPESERLFERVLRLNN